MKGDGRSGRVEDRRGKQSGGEFAIKACQRNIIRHPAGVIEELISATTREPDKLLIASRGFLIKALSVKPEE